MKPSHPPSLSARVQGRIVFCFAVYGRNAGRLFVYFAPYLAHATLTPVIYAGVGKSSLAIAIISSPLTIMLLALEITGVSITALVLSAVIASSLVVHTTFGYSLAT